MPRLLFLFCLLGLLASCSTQRAARRAEAALKSYTAALQQQQPVPPDSLKGYPRNDELDLLDALQKKYPGTLRTRTVTKVQTITLPGKTIYITLPVRVDTVANRVMRDSLLSQIQQAALNAQENSQLKAALARLSANLLKELNRRGCLPDTTVALHNLGFDVTVRIQPLANGRYGFTLEKASQDIQVPATITENNTGRAVYEEKYFYQFWQFWAAAAVAVVSSGAFLYLVYLDSRQRIKQSTT